LVQQVLSVFLLPAPQQLFAAARHCWPPGFEELDFEEQGLAARKWLVVAAMRHCGQLPGPAQLYLNDQ
jgi:hypothetical protein